MDVMQNLLQPSRQPISCIEMHTTGEPTRIVIRGYPNLTGTLLEQRAEAKRDHDHVRRQLMQEPRGHFDMYGAILRPETELTKSGDAHIGVLFTTNEGYSTMCGHATIALGYFLVDTHDSSVFPAREKIKFDPESRTAVVNLHAPCGLVVVTVPTTLDGSQSDPTRLVSFISVPSFATGIGVQIPIPEDRAWPLLQHRRFVTAEFSYGGAFYCILSAVELGFLDGLSNIDVAALDQATHMLKAAVNNNLELRHLFQHPEHEDLGFLYSIMVVDNTIGVSVDGSIGAETGLCFFADQQVDRSPTGSAVAARVALAYAQGALRKEEEWTYHSLVSNAWQRGAFIGKVVSDAGIRNRFPIVRVQVSGHASYVGYSTWIVDEQDPLGGDGFIFNQLGTVKT